MKFYVLLIFCCSVQSIPVNKQTNVPLFDSENLIENEDAIQQLDDISSEQCSDLLELENGNLEQPSRLSLMTVSNENESENQDVDKIISEMIYRSEDVMLPPELEAMSSIPPLPLMQQVPPFPWNNLNHMQEFREETKGFPYQLPPHMYENIITSMRTLPPVSVQIHESLAEIENQESGDNSVDNDLYLPNVRQVRSREEDLLEQLKHDAMIPNIIPTMPIPFLRTSEASKYPNTDAPLVMIIFPGKVSNCAVPFLLGCSPNVVYGTLATYGGYPPLPPPFTDIKYRKEPHTVKSVEGNQKHKIMSTEN